MDKVNELEQAILARANRLADQYREQGRNSRAELLREAASKLRLLEEREVLVAKALAERAYRRRVQSQELKLQARLDQLRWNLVTALGERLEQRLRELVSDEIRYLSILRELLATGAAQMEAEELVVQVNQQDHERLAGAWDDFSGTVPGKRLQLSDRHLSCIGGLLLRTPDNSVRLDNTFEGRMHRLRSDLHQVIQERLLPPSAEDMPTAMGAP